MEEKTSSSAPAAQAQQMAPAAAPINQNTSAAPAAQSAPAPAAISAPVNVNVTFTNESDREPAAAQPAESEEAYWGEVFQKGVGGAYAKTYFRTNKPQSATMMNPGLGIDQVQTYQESCLKPVTTPEEEQAKGAAPYKKGIGIAAVIAAVIAAAFIGWAIHGCSNRNVPPAPPTQQTVMVQPAQVPAPTCDPVVVSPVVVTTPAPVVNVTTPETRVVTRTITKEVPVQTPAPVASARAGIYSLNVRTVPAAQAPVVPAEPVAPAPAVAPVAPAAPAPAAPASSAAE